MHEPTKYLLNKILPDRELFFIEFIGFQIYWKRVIINQRESPQRRSLFPKCEQIMFHQFLFNEDTLNDVNLKFVPSIFYKY